MQVAWCVILAVMALASCQDDEGGRIYTISWAVEVLGGPAVANTIARKHGFENLGQVASLKNFYHFVLQGQCSPRLWKRANTAKTVNLKREKHVVHAEQQYLRRQVRKYIVPSDPLWTKQWTLLNKGQTSEAAQGRDLNVEPVWMQGITGCNSVVAVVDDGVQYNHNDLSSNYLESIGWDFLGQDNDPYPNTDVVGHVDSHGTSCAGEIAMEKNNEQCGIGIAYNSGITGVRILGNTGVTDIQEANALAHFNDFIQVYSNSWGPSDDGQVVSKPGMVLQKVLENVESGRGGKGSIWVWAAGNGGGAGDSCAADGYASSIYTIAIGSASADGTPAYYDEQCSAKMATNFVNSASLQVTTTEANNQCTSEFDGTSASCPIASGTIALVLEVFPDLSWRDIQYLIVYTSNPFLFVDDGLSITNAAGNKWHPNFGFGAIDAEAMVNRARNWTTVPVQQINTGTILDGTCSILAAGTHDFNFSYFEDIVYVEHVVVSMTLQMNNVVGDSNNSRDYSTSGSGSGSGSEDKDSENRHSSRGDISITLMSPLGTRSTLLPERPKDLDISEGYNNWPFMSVAYWGENPSGRWSISVAYSGNKGSVSVSGVSYIIYGTTEAPQSVSQISLKCHPACALPQRCSSGRDSRFCDSCAAEYVRNPVTLECMTICNLTVRSGYCYDPSQSEPKCVRAKPPPATMTSSNSRSTVSPNNSATPVSVMGLKVTIKIFTMVLLIAYI